MRQNAERAIREGLKHEGGFVNHPEDPGGATNKGITLTTFRRYLNPKGTIADLKRLTDEQAIHIYKRRYWNVIRGDDLPSGVDLAVYDFAINSGPSRAARHLQSVVGASVDGRIGPQTIEHCARCEAPDVINQICDQRLAFMKRIRGGSLWKTFGRGWQRRVDEVRASSLDLAEQCEAEDMPAVLIDGKPASQSDLRAFFQRWFGG